MAFSKKLFVRIGIVGFLLAGTAWAFFPRGASQTFVTDTVQRGTLEQTVEVTGELKSVTDLSLAFETSGTISSVNVEVGDTVAQGDVLAELSTTELSAVAEQARLSVVAAQADLEIKLAGLTTEEEIAQRAQVAVVEAQVAAATVDVIAAQTAQTLGDIQDDASVASALSDYDQVTNQNTESTAQATENLMHSLSASLGTIRAGLESADQIVAVENTLFGLNYRQYLGILDQTTMSDAKDVFRQAATARDQAEDLVLALSATSTESDVAAAYSSVSTAMTLTSQTLLYVSRVLDATVSDTREFSNDDLIALRAMIAGERATVTAGMSALLSAKQSYDSALRLADDRMTDATNTLALARAQQAVGNASRASGVAKAEASLTLQNASLTKAQADLAAILAEPRDIDLAGFEAALGRAKAEYTAALARLRKAQIIAPIDGIITTVAFEIGEQVSAGSEVIAEIAADDAFEIVLDVPEADISKLAVGQKADITFDAFGDRAVFSGTVYSLDPAEKIISDVVFYEAKIVLSTDQNLSLLKPGMSADVVIHTDHKEGVLFVPTRAVLERNGAPYVRVPKSESEFDDVFVTIGLKADEGRTEIVSGLTEGQTVVLSVKTK